MPKTRFVLNDETVKNSYGFSIRTGGIGLSRFSTNPVMMKDHGNKVEDVIGKWVDLKVENGQLTAEPEFDENDKAAQKVQAKVEGGYVRAASIGIQLSPESFQMEDGELVLGACELYEASIVSVPSNANALRMYNGEGVQLQPQQIQQLCLSATNKQQPKIDKPMSKFMLTALAIAALGLETKDDYEAKEVSEAVIKLNAEKNELQTKLDAYDQAEKNAAKTKQLKLVKDAIDEGRITADQKEDYEELAASNYELAAKTLASLPTKKSFAPGTKTPGKSGIETMEDFQKLSINEQVQFKDDYPEKYAELVNTINQ